MNSESKDRISSFYLEKLKTHPLILDRSDKEKNAAARLLEEELVMVQLKRWIQGFIPGIVVGCFMALSVLLLKS